MAISRITQGTGQATNNPNTTIDSTGAEIIVAIVHRSGSTAAVSNVTDSQSNTYTELEAISSGATAAKLFVCTSPTNNASLTITGNTTGGTFEGHIIVACYDGVDSTTPYYNNNSTTGDTLSFTPTAAGDAIISCGVNGSSSIGAYGTDQVQVGKVSFFSTMETTFTEELSAGASADSQVHTSAAFIFGVILKENAGPDVTAPVLQSAVVENAAPSDIVLTYDEALDATSTPANGDFTNIAPSRTVTGVVVSGTTVTITVNTPFANGDVIDFDYTASTNPIQDLAGNNAANLTNQAVTNNISAPSTSDIRIESFDVTLSTATSGTISITDVGDTSKAFIRLLGCSRHDSAGPIGSFSNQNYSNTSFLIWISATDTISWSKTSTAQQKIMFEVWRYVGDPGGDYEFITRHREEITASGVTQAKVDRC